MNGKKITGKYLILYTAAFCVLCLLVFFPFLKSGKSLIGNGDGQSQYILQLEYMGRYLRGWLAGIVRGEFTPARYDFTIGMGDDISTVVRFHPLDFLSVFVPSAYTETLYHVLIFLRLYLAGLAFSVFVFSWKRGFMPGSCTQTGASEENLSGLGIIAGCMVYLFQGYTFSLGIVHPIYISPMITLPLLLYGAERIMHDEGRYRFLLLTLTTALGFISNYYFMYIESIALLFYVVVRFFQLHAGQGGAAKAKALASLFFRMTAAYAAGLMISAVTLFPVIARYLSSYRSERISEVNNLLIYADKRRYIAWLINLISPLRASGNGTHLNYAVIVLPAAVLLISGMRNMGRDRLKRQTRQLLLICMLAVLICLLLPAGGYVMAVMNNENNRWVFLIALVLGGTVSYEWDELITCGQGRKRLLLGFAAAFDLMILIESVIIGTDIYNIAGGVQLTLFTVALIIVSGKTKRAASSVVMLGTVASVAIGGVMTFGHSFGNLTRYYMDRGTSLRTYRDSAYSVYTRTNDTSFFRTDGVFSGNNEDNASLYLGYRGVQMYNSVLNRSEIDALLQTGNPGLTTMLHVHNLDGHTVMSSLCGVKYFLADRKNYSSVPCGFMPEPVYTEGRLSLYENGHPLGMTFARDKVITSGEAQRLNPVEREYAMLYAVLVDDNEVPEGARTLTAEDFRSLGVIRTEYQALPSSAEGIEKTAAGYEVKDSDASLSMNVKMHGGEECYLLLEGLDVGQAQKMKIRSGGLSKTVTLLDDGAAYTLGRKEYAVRLGRSDEDKVIPVTIRFTEAGPVSLKSMSLVYADEKNMLSCLDGMQEDRLGTEFGKDFVKLNLDRRDSGIQVFSIQFGMERDSGWYRRRPDMR